MKTIKLDDIEYVRVDSINQQAKPNIDGLEYVMIRTYSAGVHCGWLEKREGKEVHLLESIRIWKWSGAASLSQLSQEGTNDASNCKFGMPVSKIILTEAIEVISMTEKAKSSILKVESWKK